MGVRFIIGSAGAGKTHTCLDEVRAAAQGAPDGPPLILLVPEQATFQVEQALLTAGGITGSIRAQVLSFARLAWQLSLKAGGLALPPLSDLGKRMVLRALLERRREDLRLFGQVADRPGFIDKLASSISEMRSYQHGPESLTRHLASLAPTPTAPTPDTPTASTPDTPTATAAKLHDLALVMQELKSYTDGRFTDPDDLLLRLAERLPQSGLLAGAEVWIDGFSGFTPQELAVLGAIFGSARQSHITLCIPPQQLHKSGGHHDPTDLFHPTLSTYDQLVQVTVEQQVTLDPPLLLRDNPRFTRAAALRHLEQEFFQIQPQPFTGDLTGIRLLQAQNRREEVETAAREVLRLVREEGLRYRQVAVVARNLDAYGDLTASVFAEHGIPAFVDRRRTVAHHPVVELLRAALETIIQDWAYAPVFRYLKTDLTDATRDEIDMLENYVIEHGIRGRTWQEPTPWQFVRRYTLEQESEATEGQKAMLERLHQVRSRATAELTAFGRRISRRGGKGLTVREITTALFQLLDDLKAARRLEHWSGEAELSGDLGAAREHEQVWDSILNLFDQMVEAMGDTTVTPVHYLRILTAGLDGVRLGQIPPGLDQVVVGTVERSRHSGVRAALILGATEKDFPPQPPEDAIFTDREREQLQGLGIELGPTSLLRLFHEQYFTYVALTRGSEELYLSYPLSGEDGRALTPSPVLRRLQSLFPGLVLTQAADPLASVSDALRSVVTPVQLAAGMARALRHHRSGYPLDPDWLNLYQWAVSDERIQPRVAPVLAAVAYEEGFLHRSRPLDPETARLLYGDQLQTSVSRLEAFTACPFQHFSAHGLRLSERGRFEVSAPELGLFYHAALSLFVRQLETEGRSWSSLSAAEAALIMDRLVDQLAPRLQSEILLSTPQHKYLLRVMRRTLQASLGFLGEHMQHGQFLPLWVELPFGEHGQDPSDRVGNGNQGLPPVTAALPDGSTLRLRGRIDRVDGFNTPDGEWYLRVFDYKSSPRGLDLGRFYHGLSLQLMLYLFAVVHGGERLMPGERYPAGALYFPVHDPLERLAVPESAEQLLERRRKQFRAKGLLAAQPEVIAAMDGSGLGLTQVRLNRDGSIRKNSPVADAHQFDLLFGHLKRVVVQSATRLLSGDAAVAPVRLAGKTPCGTCDYRSVCQFDPTVTGQNYRPLARLKPADVWDQIRQEQGNGQTSHLSAGVGPTPYPSGGGSSDE